MTRVQTAPGESGSLPAVDLPEGSIVGEYRIERKLKHGGMGTVYEAVHQVINKRVAVKVLKRELCENGDALHRFVQEARAVNQINHPNIVDVFGFGITEDGRSFLAMELLVGETLGERMGRGPIPRIEVCEILTEITHALEAAHACGVVHRDLKPENVFLAAGRAASIVKLLDFGIAKLTGGGGMQGPVEVTQPGTLIGTPKYIAPEQARGLAIDGSADVYALGVIAFELLTGRAPFTANDPVELIAKHITLKPPAPSELAEGLPRIADELVVSMLDKLPANRPGLVRIRELLAELASAPDARLSSIELRRPATTIVSALGEPAPDKTIPDIPISDDEAPRRRRWWPLVLGGLASAAVGVRVAVGIADRSDSAGPPPVHDALDVSPALAPAPPAPAPPEPTITPIETPTVPADAAPAAEPEPDIEVDPGTPTSPPAHKPPAHKPPRHAAPKQKPAEPATPTTTTTATTPKPPDEPKPPPDKDKDKAPDDPDALRDPFHH